MCREREIETRRTSSTPAEVNCEVPVPQRFVFEMEADADPDALLRIAAQLNLANRCPTSVTLCLREDQTLAMETVLEGLTPHLADLICRKLTQLTCVRDARLRSE